MINGVNWQMQEYNFNFRTKLLCKIVYFFECSAHAVDCCICFRFQINKTFMFWFICQIACVTVCGCNWLICFFKLSFKYCRPSAIVNDALAQNSMKVSGFIRTSDCKLNPLLSVNNIGFLCGERSGSNLFKSACLVSVRSLLGMF